MKLPLYFASSSKVWSSPEWVYGIEECGYDGWEISADGNYRLDNPEAFAKIKEIMETTHLAISVHAPFTDLNIGSLNDPIYRESIRQMQLCVTKAADITDVVTIHPPGYVSPPHGRLVPQKVWNLHKEALREIGATGIDTGGVRVCLENMPKIPDFLCMEADEHYGMIEGVDGIHATVDLGGHANTTGQVKSYLDCIGTATHMHIHDNRGRSDEHLALGGQAALTGMLPVPVSVPHTTASVSWKDAIWTRPP